MTTFVVAGSATDTHPAERGTARISIGFTSDDRKSARTDAITAHNAVAAESLAHQESGAATSWHAENVQTQSFRDYVKDGSETVLRFRASSTIVVEFQDFAALADWVSDLAERSGVSVDGIEWTLTHSVRTKLERTVRIAAVRDAVTKAGDYAAALDLGNPTLDAVYEEGLRPGTGGGGGTFSPRMKMADAVAYDGASFQLKPGDIEVAASISADFTM